MDDVRTTLDACRDRAGAQLVALVGADGLVIEASTAAVDVEAPSRVAVDLPLVAAEATDLWTVADRLRAAGVGTGPTRDLILAAHDATVRLRRLRDGAFVLAVAEGDRGPRVDEAIDDVAPRLEAALA